MADLLDTKRECIIVDKVFDSCKQKECFPEVEVEVENCSFERVRFRPGFIIPNTLVVTEVPNEEYFRRVRFTLRIPFVVLDISGNVITEAFLPDIYKDVILYIPDARDEFDFRIVVETSSELLSEPIVQNDILYLTVGTYVIVKVVATVQLQIPAYGYCPTPPDCTEYSPEDICDEFIESPEFPDFFPLQLEDQPI
jgi:hypothetical protein